MITTEDIILTGFVQKEEDDKFIDFEGKIKGHIVLLSYNKTNGMILLLYEMNILYSGFPDNKEDLQRIISNF